MLIQMLRPVPSRPPGPVDPAEARAFVAASLPSVDEASISAFSLVVLGGLPRSSVPELSPAEVSLALAKARKEVRRAAWPLPGSGWCERAELLISDRLDDCLDDSRLLDAHLANCERCVEHERRVVQAQDGLVASFVSAQPDVSPPPVALSEPPALKVIEEPAAAQPAVISPEPPRPQRQPLALTGLAWSALAVLAVLLTVAAIAITVAGALGAL
jgi:anti-sigma factor RsiW